MDVETERLIKPNPVLKHYYNTLESRVGYRAFLGGTRHFGYYDPGTYWPFPITPRLRAMEEHMFQSLRLRPGSAVLDAGCGVGHVAMYMAKKGLHVTGIDITDHHVEKARNNVRLAGLEDSVTVRRMDYHHLESFPDKSFDGVYTMETLVHASDPERVLNEFFRVLKPGGTLTEYEYDHVPFDKMPKNIRQSFDKINGWSSMPGNVKFEVGTLPRMMERAGFEGVRERDLSDNVRPLVRLFFVAAYLPYLIIQLFGLEKWFINAMAGVEIYRVRNHVGYKAFTARRPYADEDQATAGFEQELKKEQ